MFGNASAMPICDTPDKTPSCADNPHEVQDRQALRNRAVRPEPRDNLSDRDANMVPGTKPPTNPIYDPYIPTYDTQ